MLDCFAHRLFCWHLAVALVAINAIGAQRLATAQEAAPPMVDAGKPVETKPDESKLSDDALKEGHSVHGEVFNEGPRQSAYLMDGCGVVKFPVTTSNAEARKFIRGADLVS